MDAAVIEVLGRDGHVRMLQRVQGWPLSIGRSPACDVVLDDGHLAPEHAQLTLDEQSGQPQLTLLPSRNGGWLGRRRLAAGNSVALEAGATFQLGATQLRLRRASDAQAPEQPLLLLASAPAPHWLLLGLLAWAALLWLEQWSSLNPDARWVDFTSPVLAPLGLLLGWAGLWALLSQLFQHKALFRTHLWRGLLGFGAASLMWLLLPALAYMFSLPRLQLESPLTFVLLAGLLWWHASLVWPRARKALGLVLAGLLLGGLVLTAAKRQGQQHWFQPLYLSTLPPPVLRLAGPKPPDALIESLRPLEAELAKKASKDQNGNGEEGED